MAGVEGKFAIEDFLGAGEIIGYLKQCDLDEMALASYMSSRDKDMVKKQLKTPHQLLNSVNWDLQVMLISVSDEIYMTQFQYMKREE